VLFTGLTALEHLELFGAIKGLAPEDIARQGRALLASLNVDDADMCRPADQLSGGTKRKVSAASALLGPPGLLFLGTVFFAFVFFFGF
jgi:ABC-type multidrug transport system ATPase subunit